MDPSLLSIPIFVLLFLLLAAGMPIGFAMGLSAFLGTLLLIDAQAALALLGQTAYETALTYNLSVIPMFVLMGYIAGEAGLDEVALSRLQRVARPSARRIGARHHRRLRGVRGDLRLEPGDGRDHGPDRAARDAPLQLRRSAGHRRGRRRRHHRHPDPPSVIMVIYGLLTETSISALFLAGIVPGILTVLGFMIAISVMTRIDPKLGPPAARSSMSDRVSALKSVWGTAALFLLVIGGLYLGVFSPTEAASVGAIGALVLGLHQSTAPIASSSASR